MKTGLGSCLSFPPLIRPLCAVLIVLGALVAEALAGPESDAAVVFRGAGGGVFRCVSSAKGALLAGDMPSKAPGLPRFGFVLGALDQPVYFALTGAIERQVDEHSSGRHGEGDVPLNPLEFRTDLALWTGVVFIVLLAILGPLAWSPIARALDRRERHLAEQFVEAERRLQKAEELLREHQARLQAAGEEAQRILQRAVDEAERRATEILTQARLEAEAEHKRRLEQLEKAADEASRQLVQYAASLAVEIAGRLMRSQLDASTHRRLLSEALGQIAQVASANSEDGVHAGMASAGGKAGVGAG
ncbi:MAG: F0F1 ATP synthase subunit B [Thermoguttaceae bacterium]|nr:F0F1 ATP synthase subunit B [Thermoguttaceae bacterium]MDW8079689.1 F0F1 ATP synthase subunit B [Thermoguttaceae bacterium]